MKPISRHFAGMMKTAAVCVMAWALLCLAAPSALADIYRYVDEQGVTHYTNVPTRGSYTLYIREATLSKKLRGTPASYDTHIKEASDLHHVDFDLIKAVIKVESDFNPRAISKAGARGLMQVMPGNFVRLGISDPENPRQNIIGGTCYLRQMLNRFGGKTTLALAAYNAGPGAVEKYNSIPPYEETRNYVRKVMLEYRRLRKIRRDSGMQWQVHASTP
ncbi:lytic transglycosylase domain-containing protein [Desulfatibacillum aliphaticivorans]|uniref:lytic transglycosylase domain-containing protein n=1 Tax=Desulfatibacillum aliphaticivorans TaxID=218208 RepID=UPI00041C31DE|nr:lytic transglycosylase domain-containing protein [Desulfatibacillum aliphaticivorans]